MKVSFAVDLPDELATDLPRNEQELADILALGFREWKWRDTGEFGGLASVLERLAEQPSPEQIMALHPAPDLQKRVNELLEKNRLGCLTLKEERELQQHEFVEHLVRLAKARARAKLHAA